LLTFDVIKTVPAYEFVSKCVHLMSVSKYTCSNIKYKPTVECCQ